MKVYANTTNICGGSINCHRLVAGFNRFGWHQNDYLTSATHIEYAQYAQLCVFDNFDEFPKYFSKSHPT